MPRAPVVIVGSGLAGYTLARELRKLDREVPLVVVSRDDAAFYSKPMLSNALASGKSAAQLVGSSAAQMAAQLSARVLAKAEVRAIDPAAHAIDIDGETLAYSKLALALGADPIALPLAGDAAGQVLRVNDLADYACFRAAIDGKKRIALLGAGLIGCEFANDLAAAGYAVDVVDPAPRPLGRLLPEVAGDRLQAALEAIGVRFHFGRTARSVAHAGDDLQVELSDGTILRADAVLSAVGLKPRVALASKAGLKVNRGIVTDRYLATSAPDVYALGDCAEVEGHVLPFVLPIMQAARALAKTLAGAPTAVSYPAMPVVVKTAAMPAVVCPPPAIAGGWQVDADETGIEARFEDEGGALRGFALLGAASAKKNALAARLPVALG
jgi:rubredoxin-NAD+ reductase